MIYLIIFADGRHLRQVEQLTDELLAEYQAARVEILQIPCASGARVMELAAADGARLEWAGVKDYE